LAASTWINKYALRDSEGNLLESNPEMMHNRIIKEIMRVERMYGKSKGGKVVLTEDILKNLLYHFQYVIPGGSAMSGIGNKYRYQSISNCFVIEPPQDSYGGIFRADQELVQLMKRRGGVGTDLSNLRPNHTKVSNSALTSSGLPSFMERFSNSTREVAQGGRRGALMLSVLITHPDAEEFIDAKLVEGKIDGANISVKLTDEFMKCVKSDSKFLQKFPVDATESELGIKSLDDYTIDKLYEGEKDGTYFRVVKAKRLWDKIIKNAHDKAEPGVLFWDTILKESPADYYADKGYRTVGTNPCFTGETLIAVADGRNAVSIKDLYDKGEQFAVYCARPNESTGDKSGGWVTCVELAKAIKTGRKSVIKITLSDGSSFK
jgi:ribonucleoside-diphosphate reductase alpha chain